jgi:hypothetical protein
MLNKKKILQQERTKKRFHLQPGEKILLVLSHLEEGDEGGEGGQVLGHLQ